MQYKQYQLGQYCSTAIAPIATSTLMNYRQIIHYFLPASEIMKILGLSLKV